MCRKEPSEEARDRGKKSVRRLDLTLHSAVPGQYLGHLGLRLHSSFEFRRRGNSLIAQTEQPNSTGPLARACVYGDAGIGDNSLRGGGSIPIPNLSVTILDHSQ